LTAGGFPGLSPAFRPLSIAIGAIGTRRRCKIGNRAPYEGLLEHTRLYPRQVPMTLPRTARSIQAGGDPSATIDRRGFMIAAAAAGLWLGAGAAQAAPEADEAQNLVKRLSEQTVGVINDQNMAAGQRTSKFSELFQQGFDVPEMARFALGRYWREASDQQRQDYQTLFVDYIVAVYSQRFTGYKGAGVQITGAAAEADGKTVLVHSTIPREGAPQPIKVDWRVARGEQGPKIVDVLVEDVSMAITQRSEFASVIQRSGGIAGLLDTLKTRTQQLRSNA
jgi:phospholipid transport system substrate-binding protein